MKTTFSICEITHYYSTIVLCSHAIINFNHLNPDFPSHVPRQLPSFPFILLHPLPRIAYHDSFGRLRIVPRTIRPPTKCINISKRARKLHRNRKNSKPVGLKNVFHFFLTVTDYNSQTDHDRSNRTRAISDGIDVGVVFCSTVRLSQSNTCTGSSSSFRQKPGNLAPQNERLE